MWERGRDITGGGVEGWESLLCATKGSNGPAGLSTGSRQVGRSWGREDLKVRLRETRRPRVQGIGGRSKLSATSSEKATVLPAHESTALVWTRIPGLGSCKRAGSGRFAYTCREPGDTYPLGLLLTHPPGGLAGTESYPVLPTHCCGAHWRPPHAQAPNLAATSHCKLTQAAG